MKNKSAITLIELLIVLVIGLVIGLILLGMSPGAIGTIVGKSDGKRIGVLTKFSYKGVFIKSYEGELNLGGLRNGMDNDGNQTVTANVWTFSVSDQNIAKKVEDLVGKQVMIKYHQSFAGISRDTSYDVVEIQEVK